MLKKKLVPPKYHFTLASALLVVLLAALFLLAAGCASNPAPAPAPSLALRQTETLTTLGFKKVDDNWKLILPERVLFKFDQVGLKPELRNSIVDVARQLLAVQIHQVRVEGHTDNVGPREYNQDLSLRRANSVASVLVSEGFTAENVDSKGYGADRPAADNSIDEGRAENRRVEIIVLSTVLSLP